ncbi:expressed unknown protein [Seminavis robusta]|uniref:Uncharacterized protein n=1 Tax=Seminavis robusta TaxID=568900 RepID=A0A9N8EVD6_9STRA|nr:expressed unknown protein [Seminavis robusta]|eukprot:Sro2110_g314990.1 n/a (421) ;mRNA; f:6377-7639
MPSSFQDRESVDPLLSRFNLEEEIVFDNQQPDSITTSGNNEPPIHQLLGTIGGLLDNADNALEDLHSNNPDLLGSAIVRTCQELADAVGHVAQELEQQSDGDRRALANACLQDTAAAVAIREEQIPNNQLMAHDLTANDIVSALDGVSYLLRDVEVGLRGIEKDEADEIADVALTLARLFVASLQSCHSSVVQQEEERQEERRRIEAERFELLEEDDTTNPAREEKTQESKTKKKQRMDRLRVLWPPLGPAVASACNWGKDEAIQRPILAVALGMTLWPAAVMTAFFGAPLVIADTVIQHGYNTFQDGPIVSNVEKSAAQLIQAGKLSLLCTKLVTRQSLRVVHRQLERQGGVVPVAQNLLGMAVDRALHPVETVSAVWDGVQWAVGMVQHHVLNHNNQDGERPDATPAVPDDRDWRDWQ